MHICKLVVLVVDNQDAREWLLNQVLEVHCTCSRAPVEVTRSELVPIFGYS